MKRPASLSASADAGGRRRVDVRGWLGNLRLSGFTVIMLGIVALAVFVLVPTVSTYVGQQQQIAALQHSVQVTEDDVAALKQEHERWLDPAYIATAARERLYYVKPGDVVYLVIDDLPASRQPQQQAAVSKSVEQTKTDWTSQLVESIVQAGTAKTAVTG